MILICPKCGSKQLQYENTTILKGEMKLDKGRLIEDTLNIFSINSIFYCLKCDYHTNNINDLDVEDDEPTP